MFYELLQKISQSFIIILQKSTCFRLVQLYNYNLQPRKKLFLYHNNYNYENNNNNDSKTTRVMVSHIKNVLFEALRCSNADTDGHLVSRYSVTM